MLFLCEFTWYPGTMREEVAQRPGSGASAQGVAAPEGARRDRLSAAKSVGEIESARLLALWHHGKADYGQVSRPAYLPLLPV